MTILKREPALLRALLVGIIGATLRLLAEFGLRLSETQADAIVAWADAAYLIVLLLAAGVAIRPAVTPTDSVVYQLDRAGTLVAGPAVGAQTGTLYEGQRYEDADGDGNPDLGPTN